MRRFLTLLAAALLLATSLAPVAATPRAGADHARSPEAKGGEAADRARGLERADAVAANRLGRSFKSQLGSGNERRTYLIRLQDAAVPSYEGGQPGLPPTAPAPGARLEVSDPAARAYRGHLEEAQVEFIERLERSIGRNVEVPFTYQFAVNGLAAVLTPAEAREIADDPAVAWISLDEERELHTDAGPQWLGADAVWDAMAQLGLPADYKGEGIVIGTIDTGISPGNRSFADVGDDGYDHTNPLGPGNFLGACDESNTEQFDPQFVCNDKLIGAYVFGNANETAVDYDGHGSHTSSTSGGNVVQDVVVETAAGYVTQPFDISGVAPHANIISYLGCCTLSGLTAAIDQAIADEVDVINYSIGSSAPSALWSDFDTVGFLNARAAGIFVATSNGNDGPGFATTGSPSDAPWILSVGASTHNRHNGNVLGNLTSSAGSHPDIDGKSVTGGLSAPTEIVYAGDVGDPLCQDTKGHRSAFRGNIVICDRGINGRVEKSHNVAAQGAAGFVLVNDEANGASMTGDEFAIPGVFISFADGQSLKEWLSTGTGHLGTIAGTTFSLDDGRGDIMASFSSRGPNRAVDTIVPSVTAPGVDVLAAVGADSYTSDIHGFISGTSMASPHAAGAAALLTQARPEWTPAQMQSALMTTARGTVLNHDGAPATPYAQGSGHINVADAMRAGLLFDETHQAYLDANPAEGGDAKTLNLPSFANSQCLADCSWERTATVPASAPAGVTWTASTTTDPGLSLTVGLSAATVSPGDTVDISVTANVSSGEVGETLFGRITLTPDASSVPTVTMPVAVVPTTGVLPGSVQIETRRNAGSYPINGIESIEVGDFTATVAGMVPATLQHGALAQDSTNGDPYDDLAQVDVYTLDVPAGATRLVAESLDTEMPDLDLFLGTGATPSLETEVCASTTPTATEQCDIADPEAGTWWVLVQNWEGTDAQPDEYTLATGVVPNLDVGNAGMDGPTGTVAAGAPYDVLFHWDIPEMEPGERWYGTASLGSSASSPGDIGSFPVTILRAEDDVTKTASTSTALEGETVSYELTIQPNVTPTDLVYTIVDTVPDGLTVDPASVTEGGVVDGQTITWEVAVPTSAGIVGDYVLSTPATSQQCLDWSGFIDLADFSIPFAGLDGDTVSATAFSGIGPFPHYGRQYPALTVSEDGFVTVAGGYGGAPWVAQAIPDPEFPNGVFAPLWADLELSLADNRGMRLAQSSDAAIIQWDDPFEWTADDTVGPSVGKFQAWIYNTVEDFRPEMTFEYDSLGALPSVATIGTEEIAGALATSVVAAGDPSGALTAGGTYCLDYAGPSFDPITLGYDVSVPADAADATFTNEASHVTDDPYAEVETVSFELDVASVQTVSIDPATYTFTGQFGKEQQFTATAALTNGASRDVTASATWASSDEGVALVDDAGLVTSVAGGVTEITATFEEVAGTASVRVRGRPQNAGPPAPGQP